MTKDLVFQQSVWGFSPDASEPREGVISVACPERTVAVKWADGETSTVPVNSLFLSEEEATEAVEQFDIGSIKEKISSLPKLLSFLYSQEWRDTPAGSPVDQAVREKIKELADIEVAIETEAKPAVVKPVAYTIADQSYPFATWIDSLIKHCEVIIEKHGIDVFAEKALAIKTTARATKRKVFAESEEDMRGFAFHKFSDNLFLLKNQNSAQVELINKQLNDAFPEEAIDYSFE